MRLCRMVQLAMVRSDNLYALPDNLPIPLNDGACDHLSGMAIPSVSLRSTSGDWVNLAETHGWTVVYCYPRTAQPDQDLPLGWNDIPGARGCTPQACTFRDHHRELLDLGVNNVYGLSTQDTAYQQEVVNRLHLPFALLSDEQLEFTRSLRLPTFEISSMQLMKRLTLIIQNGRIEKVFYPVFPPDQNAKDVISFLQDHTH